MRVRPSMRVVGRRPGATDSHLAQIRSNRERPNTRAAEQNRPRDTDVLRVDPRSVPRQRPSLVAILRADVRREKRTVAVVNRRAGNLRLRAQRRERGVRLLMIVERHRRRRVLAEDAGERVEIAQHLVAKRSAVVPGQPADSQQQRCQARQHEPGHQLAADREIAETRHLECGGSLPVILSRRRRVGEAEAPEDGRRTPRLGGFQSSYS